MEDYKEVDCDSKYTKTCKYCKQSISNYKINNSTFSHFKCPICNKGHFEVYTACDGVFRYNEEIDCCYCTRHNSNVEN